MVRAKLFGTFQINSLIAFKKLVNDLEFDEMVLEHLKLIEQFPDNKVPVNQYGMPFSIGLHQ